MKQNNNSDKDTLDAMERLQEHSFTQIDRAWKAYGILGALIAALIAVAAILLNNNIAEIRSDIQAQSDRMLQLANDQVNARVDKAFREESIASLVESQAVKRIDEIADVIISNRIQSTIAPMRHDLEDKLAIASSNLLHLQLVLDSIANDFHGQLTNTEAAIAAARETMRDIEARSDYSLVVMSANNDDMSSFLRLRSWSTNNASGHARDAQNAIAALNNRYASPQNDTYYSGISINTNVDVRQFTAQQLIDGIGGIQSHMLTGWLHTMWDNTNIAISAKTEVMCRVLKGLGNSIQASHYAAKCLADESHISLSLPLEFDEILSWCATNINPEAQQLH